MSTNFFTNEGQNTLLNKIEGVFKYNKLSDNFGKDFIKDFAKELTDRQQIILEILSANPAFSARAISEKVPVSERTIENDLAVLKKYGLIRRIGGRKEGYWQVLI